MARYLDFSLDQGATLSRKVNYQDSNKANIDLTGFDVRAQMRRSQYSANAVSITATVSDALNGEITLSLPANVTASVKPGRWFYDVEANTAGDATVIRVVEGIISVMPGVTGNGTLIIPTGATTTDVAEGSNLYFTNVRARTAVELTVNAIANVNYTLVSTDSNTIVYASNANVIVPHNSSVAFRNGQEIIVSTGSSPVIIDRSNTQTSIYLSGNTQAGVWIIPPRTRASLLKLESEVWYLDGKDIVRF
jgi:hypothetical protein